MSFEVRERPAPGAEVSRDARQRVVTGRFTLEASADRTQVPTGDAIAITVKISGVGNTKSVELATPQIDGLDFLAPEYRDQVEAPSDLVRGERTITWLAVPKRAGTYIIPPFEIAAFDPSTSAYQTLQTQPIRVTAAGNAVGAAPANEPTEPDAEPDTAQLPPLRVASQLERARPPWVRLIRFWVLLIAPAVLWILLLLGTAWQRARERARLAGSPAALVRDARKRFEAAAKSPEDAAAFYAAAAHALVTAIESRIGQSVAGMTYPSMRSLFTAKGMDTDLASRIVDELEGCDFARFSASGTSSKETRECTERVRVLLERLEKLPMVRSKPIAAEATA